MAELWWTCSCDQCRVLHLLSLSYFFSLICLLLFTLIVLYFLFLSTPLTLLRSSCSDILYLHRPFRSAHIGSSCSTLFTSFFSHVHSLRIQYFLLTPLNSDISAPLFLLINSIATLILHYDCSDLCWSLGTDQISSVFRSSEHSNLS